MSTSDSRSSHRASELDLSNPHDLLSYLSNTPFASTRVESLSGGTANFIFRLYLTTPNEAVGGAQTVILKHAKPWIASNEAFAYAVERQNFEATALRHVHSFLPADSVATVPAVFYHDTKAHVIIMEDAGPDARNLKHLLRESPLSESASRELGTALGRFLAAVHVLGSADAELLKYVDKNDESRRLTAWVTYGRVVSTLKGEGDRAAFSDAPFVGKDGLSEERVIEIGQYADEVQKKIHKARTEFTMGDFWTGNIVVRLTPSEAIERIFIIDWEMTKPGLTFIDFAQFIAEMNTLRRFHPEAGPSVNIALDAYVNAYRGGTKTGDEFAKRAASHVGAHMVSITPDVKSWGPKESIREVVKEGIEYLLGGMHGDARWLRSSIIGGLLEETNV